MNERLSDPLDSELGRFISRDPIGFDGGLNLYRYCHNNPVNFVDPDGLLERNPNGSLVRVDRETVTTNRDPATKIRWDSYDYHLKTINGTLIEAGLNLSGDKRFDTDCHGLTFADGKYWINNNQVQTILDNDGYYEVPKGVDPITGDIAIYRKNGEIVHSAQVVRGGRNPLILEISGSNPYPVYSSGKLRPNSTWTVTYYHGLNR